MIRNPELDPGLERIIFRCLEKDLAGAADVVDELGASMNQRGASAEAARSA
jgi:hypothetical protein